jgi:rhodanese-related sulfurtransferase
VIGEPCGFPRESHLGWSLGQPGELPRGRPLVLVCHHGGRSQHAAMLLAGAGFTRVHNLAGGVESWAVNVDPGMKRY